MGYLNDWQLTLEEIDELITDNPSLRSFMSGYTAEMKCRRIWFDEDDRASNVMKYNDHDRNKKGDIALDYKGHTFTIEVKSLQTASVKTKAGIKSGKVQCDASDRRKVKFDDGAEVETTCLKVGEFDLIAVNLFAFYGEWKFAFARNNDLPRTKSKKYTPEQKNVLLATMINITDPPADIFCMEPWTLLDDLVEERNTSV